MIKFTLDNLVYNLIVNSSEDLTVMLPHKTPSVEFDVKDNENFLSAVNDITIKLFVKTMVEHQPNIIFVGEDDKVKIITNGSFELLPNSVMEITFSTIDGGATWLVNSCNANGVTAEGAEKIANNAQEVAIQSKQESEAAVLTANSAVTVATQATGTANNAKAVAEASKTEAMNAVTVSNNAIRASTQAVDTANVAHQMSVNTQADVQALSESLNDTNDAVTEVKQTSETHTLNLEDITKEIQTMKAQITNLISHVINVENNIFWIDESTLESTRPAVDPDTLTPLQ